MLFICTFIWFQGAGTGCMLVNVLCMLVLGITAYVLVSAIIVTARTSHGCHCALVNLYYQLYTLFNLCDSGYCIDFVYFVHKT